MVYSAKPARFVPSLARRAPLTALHRIHELARRFGILHAGTAPGTVARGTLACRPARHSDRQPGSREENEQVPNALQYLQDQKTK